MNNFIPIILVVILFIPIATGLTRRYSATERTTILKIVFLALFVRLALGFLFALFLPDGYFGPDAIGYINAGKGLAQQWQDPNINVAQFAYTNKSHFLYQYVCGAIYYIVGDVTFAPAYFNALFGMTALLLLANLLHSIFAFRIVRNFLLLSSFFPSIILFHTYPLKDTLVFLFVMISLYNYTMYIQGKGLFNLFVSIAILFPMYFLRFYLVIILFGIYLLVIFFFAGELSVKKIARSMVAGFVLVVFSFVAGLGPKILEVTERDANVAQLNMHQSDMKTGGSAIFKEQEYKTGMDVVRYFPVRLIMFLFAPFPWQITSTASALAFLEMPIWWLLLPWWIRGFKFSIQHRHARQLLPILLYAVFVTVLFAIVEGNIGTMFRKRAQVLPIFLLLAVVGHSRRVIEMRGYSKDALLAQSLRAPVESSNRGS